MGERILLSVADADQLRRILQIMLDENEFLSPYGVRALSRYHRDHPFTVNVDGMEHRVDYEPGESSSPLFGGNSNWRGPVWFPVNYLLMEALQKFHYYYGANFKVEFPSRSGNMLTLWEVAAELSRSLTGIFLRDADGKRPVNGKVDRFSSDPQWRDLVLFYEYFHGDTGAGLGRQSSDRLDRAGDQVDAAKRRITKRLRIEGKEKSTPLINWLISLLFKTQRVR